jgi:hypothetical protein
MKHTVFTFLILHFLFLSLPSCTDFLAEKPLSQFSADTWFTNEEALHAGVVGAFSTMRDLYVVATNTPLFVTMLGTDEALYRGTNNVRASIDRYTFSSTDGCVLEYWKRYYRLVTRANTIIAKGNEITIVNDSLKNLYTANARFLRAWAYFHLVQVYGAVPLMKDHVSEFDYSVPRAPVNEVYQLIIDDLTFCTAQTLPREIRDGYANHWAAQALLGKVYLTMASAKAANRVNGYRDIPYTTAQLYSKALTHLGDVINNSGRELLPQYGDVFKIENKNKNLESLWEIQFSKEIPYGSQWSKEYGAFPNGYDSENLLGGWRANGYAGNCNLNFVPSFRDYYTKHSVSANAKSDKSYDTRRAWNLADSIIVFDKATNLPTQARALTSLAAPTPVLGDNTSTRTVQFSGITKYRWSKSWRAEDVVTAFVYSNCPNNVIALRFADVLLMYAEADLGDDGVITPEGLQAINRVVQRARGLKPDGITPVPPSETPGMDNYSTFTLHDILLERSRELCFEWWRWFDLARTGSLETFLAERNAATPTQTNFNPDRHYVFPIPLTEIQQSTNPEGLYQNPNY